MQSTPRERLLQFSHVLQTMLFERLELELGPLSGNACGAEHALTDALDRTAAWLARAPVERSTGARCGVSGESDLWSGDDAADD